MSRWNHFLEITTGRGLETRDRAGRILAVLLGTSIVLITLATMLDSLSAVNGLTDSALTLLLGVLTLLVGLVSGYLARVHNDQTRDTRAPVGTILTAALGTSMVIIAGTVLYNAVFNPLSRINPNVVSLLVAVLGGGIGATASYLGLPKVIIEGTPIAPATIYPVSKQEVALPPTATPEEPKDEPADPVEKPSDT